AHEIKLTRRPHEMRSLCGSTATAHVCMCMQDDVDMPGERRHNQHNAYTYIIAWTDDILIRPLVVRTHLKHQLIIVQFFKNFLDRKLRKLNTAMNVKKREIQRRMRYCAPKQFVVVFVFNDLENPRITSFDENSRRRENRSYVYKSSLRKNLEHESGRLSQARPILAATRRLYTSRWYLCDGLFSRSRIHYTLMLILFLSHPAVLRSFKTSRTTFRYVSPFNSYNGFIPWDVGTDGGPEASSITTGVSQGSVLGPTLWNVMYDTTLRLNLQRRVNIVGFADDIALVTVAKHTWQIENHLNAAVV
ncbi:unnamed protein product, partial [Trichogramma brassicae]